MKSNKRFNKVAYLAAVLGVMTSSSRFAYSMEFKLGDIDGRFDSSLSLGESWSLSSRDPKLIGHNSGGQGFASGSDDGRLNFDKGEAFAKVLKGYHTLELKSGDTGIVVKGKYWYDFAIADEHQDFKQIEDKGRTTGAKSSGAEFLDSYVYHNYSVGNQAGTIRVGKQILSWGAKSVINPIDVSALLRPGVDPKEAPIPVNMFYVSQHVSDNISVDTFYQLDWSKAQPVNCGTFFSPTDFVPNGCNGFPVGPDLSNSTVAKAALEPEGVKLSSEGVFFNRTLADDTPRNSGQWGLSLRWVVPSISTELRPYYVNYHSRQPYANTIGGPHVADQGFLPSVCANIGISSTATCVNALGPNLANLAVAYRIGTSQYQIAYPEDIHQYGLSFSTAVSAATAISGDINYKPNMPISINGLDEAFAVLGDPQYSPEVASGFYPIANNALFIGYKRKPVTQAQLNILHVFSNTMGADKFTLFGELGAVYVGDLEGRDEIRYGRNPVFGVGELANNQLCQSVNGSAANNCNQEGFTTTFSWGYKLRATWQYSNVLPDLTLRPSLSWSQDVSGYAPEPGYSEGAKSVTAALEADYLHRYSTTLSATSFFGGDYNINRDRDYLSLSFGVNF